ncbi:MAG: hypothetical protein IJP90_17765 [Treponema sp.]|nr:hypothetical protein [Treponema sp.]MBR0101547.1 hypothetical protein [Treponema sp.]
MMNNKIIFKPEKGTASYNPLIDNIKDTNTQEAFAEAQRFAAVLGMKHVRSIGLILFVRFSKAIPKKDKTLARLKEILKSGISFKNVSDIGCVKDSGQDWYEMDALICTFLTAEERGVENENTKTN